MDRLNHDQLVAQAGQAQRLAQRLRALAQEAAALADEFLIRLKLWCRDSHRASRSAWRVKHE